MQQLTLMPTEAPSRPVLDPLWLQAMYAQHTISDIAQAAGCSPSTVYKHLHAYGIRTRKPGDRPPPDAATPVEARLHDRLIIDLDRGHVGRSVLATRIRALAEAEQSGDPGALQAALVDLGAASAAWAHTLPAGDTHP